MEERRLGRGLRDLLQERVSSPPGTSTGIQEIPVAEITPNPFQPRTSVDKTDVADLMESIRREGVLQPVVVRKVPHGFELVVGERRWRACRELGLKSIPAQIKDVNDHQMLALALTENLIRKDLNPIEKATAFRELMQRFGLTQDQIGSLVGKDRSSIANFIRLLELPKEIRDDVAEGRISMGHARALLGTSDVAKQLLLADRIKRENLSVRTVENLVAHERKRTAAVRPPQINELEQILRRKLGTRVSVKHTKRGGKICIEYYSSDDFNRLFEILAQEKQP